MDPGESLAASSILNSYHLTISPVQAPDTQGIDMISRRLEHQFHARHKKSLSRAKNHPPFYPYRYWPSSDACQGMREFFFDVTPVGFNSILDVFRSGTLHLSSGLCALVTKNELEYWGIDELLVGNWH